MINKNEQEEDNLWGVCPPRETSFMVLVFDIIQPRVDDQSIAPDLSRGKTLMFARFNIPIRNYLARITYEDICTTVTVKFLSIGLYFRQ